MRDQMFTEISVDRITCHPRLTVFWPNTYLTQLHILIWWIKPKCFQSIPFGEAFGSEKLHWTCIQPLPISKLNQWSPGPVVMRWDSRSECSGFNPSTVYSMDIFHIKFVVKMYDLIEKDRVWGPFNNPNNFWPKEAFHQRDSTPRWLQCKLPLSGDWDFLVIKHLYLAKLSE